MQKKKKKDQATFHCRLFSPFIIFHVFFRLIETLKLIFMQVIKAMKHSKEKIEL